MSRELLNALCKHDFSTFFQRAWLEIESRDYQHNWHIDLISEYLELAEEGKHKRLIINVPPRTGKTLLVNICYPAWLLGRNPALRIIGVSYAQRLSEKIAYRSKLLMETDFYKELFPETQIQSDYNQRNNFLTTRKGGRFTTSVGGTVTGEGADYIIIDDPVNPTESLSDVQRANANDWIDQTLYSRLDEPENGRIIMIMQRLHSDDPTGHLLERSDDWCHVKIPAKTNKTLEYQAKGSYAFEGLLHEQRLNEEVLQGLESSLGNLAFTGQYLQEPIPLGGGDFTRDMFQFFSTSRFDAKRCNIYILVDPAKSKNEGADYTAMVVLAFAPDQNIYVIDGIRKRLKGVEKIQTLFELHKKWSELAGKPPVVGYEQVGLAEDVHYIKQFQQQISYRFSITEIKPPPKLDKETRIRRLIPFFERKQIWLAEDLYHKNDRGLSENLINVIIEQEFLLFPRGLHDDFIDAMCMILDLPYYFPKNNQFKSYNRTDINNDSNSIWDMI